jgi:hypothetical protein
LGSLAAHRAVLQDTDAKGTSTKLNNLTQITSRDVTESVCVENLHPYLLLRETSSLFQEEKYFPQ